MIAFRVSLSWCYFLQGKHAVATVLYFAQPFLLVDNVIGVFVRVPLRNATLPSWGKCAFLTFRTVTMWFLTSSWYLYQGWWTQDWSATDWALPLIGCCSPPGKCYGLSTEGWAACTWVFDQHGICLGIMVDTDGDGSESGVWEVGKDVIGILWLLVIWMSERLLKWMGCDGIMCRILRWYSDII